MDLDQLDKAYIHYLRASEVTVNLIPRHPDYRAAVNQRPGWYKEFASLMMVREISDLWWGTRVLLRLLRSE